MPEGYQRAVDFRDNCRGHRTVPADVYARVGALIVVGVTVALGGLAQAQAVAVSVDATAPGMLLERVWAFHGYDEINYTTSPEGQTLLGEIAAAHTVPPHIRGRTSSSTRGTASRR